MMTDALIKTESPTRHATGVLGRPIVFLRVCCSILILLTKSVRCNIRSL